jgi:glycosyltransferase involved in cell wall biosynthesis
MKPLIAIIYTTFLREDLAQATIESILNSWSDKFVLMIGEQTNEDYSKLHQLYGKDERIVYTKLPFDCGVSFARNALIDKAIESDIPLCILTADSLAFSERTLFNLDKAIDLLSHSDISILGFDIEHRTPWEYNLDMDSKRFILQRLGKDTLRQERGLSILDCEICRQFFICKTMPVHQVRWDVELKTADHEDFFWRFKQAGYRVAWTPDISGRYIEYKPLQYLKYRNRMYSIFRKKLLKKYNLRSWVTYK